MNHPTDNDLKIRLPGLIGISSAVFAFVLCFISLITSLNRHVLTVGQTQSWPTTVSRGASTITTRPLYRTPTARPLFNTATPEPYYPEPTQSNAIDPSILFPSSLSDISDKLIAGDVDEVTLEELSSWTPSEDLQKFEEWGRLATYQRFYDDPEKCDADDLKGVYIQITFFQSADGAKSFFDWASEGAPVEFIDSVGDDAYVFRGVTDEDGCQVDFDSIAFTRYNVFVRVRVRSITGTMEDDDVDAILEQVTSFIDAKLIAEAR